MRTYRLKQFGSLDHLVDQPQERPRVAPGAVLVRIRASSLNYRDLMIVDGTYPVPAKPGVVPVSDGAGEVVEIGEGVTRLAVGDRVASLYLPRWQDGAFTGAAAVDQFGCTRDGVLAGWAMAEETAWIKFPAHLSYEEASCLPCAGVTAWSALHGPRPVTAGDTVLTLGSGGVAVFALQFAKMAGARVIALTSTEEKAQRLRQLGADHTVLWRGAAAWEAQVRELTQGRGVDHVVETGGTSTLPRSLASLALDGHIAIVTPTTGPLDTGALKGLFTLRRVLVGSAAAFGAMNRAIVVSGMKPVIGASIEFQDAKQAYVQAGERSHLGKIVIGGAPDS